MRRRGVDEPVKATSEMKRSNTLRCKKCKELGHNSRTCKGVPVGTGGTSTGRGSSSGMGRSIGRDRSSGMDNSSGRSSSDRGRSSGKGKDGIWVLGNCVNVV